MRKSQKRGKFSIEQKVSPEVLDFVNNFWEQKRKKEEEPEWKQNNLEYDLRNSEMIAEKCKDDSYAQNLYAALCNNEFIKNDVWPLLADKKWSCSWRYAGGIIADIREDGDYIDWYCSGIIQTIEPEDFEKLTLEQKERYLITKNYVNESVVTEEIRQDLKQIGWLVIDSEENAI